MIPIKDTIRSRSFPVVTWAIIIANVLVFLYESNLTATGLQHLIYTYGLVPVDVTLTNPTTWFPLISHAFLHGSWLHLISNMWTLFIFGDNVEDRMGSGRFLAFYLVGGVAAGIIQMVLGGDPSMPSVGASGAIAAILGAYFLYFPTAKVVTFIPVLLFVWFINIPAVIYLGFWFISQLFSGLSALTLPTGASAGGIAWWAHIGGFVFGLVLALVFTGRKPKTTYYRDEYYPW